MNNLIKKINFNFNKTFPWIKSREILFIKVLFDLLIFFAISHSNFYQSNFCFFYSFYLIFIPSSWIILSYIIGRYEIDKSIIERITFKHFYKTLITAFTFFQSNELLKISFADKITNTFEFNKLLLFFLISYLIQFFINKFIKKNFSNSENWIFLNTSNEPKLIKDILNFSRIKINIQFLDFKSLKEKNLKNIDGIVIDKFKKNIENQNLFYRLKQNDIKVLKLFEWVGLNLQRYPTELIYEDDSILEQILLKKSINNFQMRLKRISEFIISLVILILAIPVIVVSAILIKIEDGGSIFYSQIRTGFQGREFKIYKMRTMKIDCEKDGPVWSSKNDQRITKIGSFLRKSRFDELPQLLLVITGKLSLIGPRPERPGFDNLLKDKIPYYSLRYQMKPGLSGWAQVNYPYGASENDARNKLSYDLYYINNFSNLLDILILLKTIKLVLNRKGAIALN